MKSPLTIPPILRESASTTPESISQQAVHWHDSLGVMSGRIHGRNRSTGGIWGEGVILDLRSGSELENRFRTERWSCAPDFASVRLGQVTRWQFRARSVPNLVSWCSPGEKGSLLFTEKKTVTSRVVSLWWTAQSPSFIRPELLLVFFFFLATLKTIGLCQKSMSASNLNYPDDFANHCHVRFWESANFGCQAASFE